MPDEVTGEPVRQFHFIRSGDNPTQPLAWGQGQEQVRKALGEALSKHLAEIGIKEVFGGE